jgi:hypothetical protein
MPRVVWAATLSGTKDSDSIPREVFEMAGKIKRLIEGILAERAKGNELLAKVIRTKLILKGINPAHYSDQSDDDPAILKKLENMLQDLHR